MTFDKMENVKQTDGTIVGGVKLKVSMARRQPMLEAATFKVIFSVIYNQ